ncbi:hypothetical protein CcI49_15005 [Frankia sp. CcI49]|uniref:DUF6603 domain-containing protein n=1 Tax=Frankia sp. CcI49 TaxID=1745382 RepID=UPI0009777D00|nr:DUF6603 domain-containing protein [Frankia sp. CcI49]ONH60006.1 hypothetical protein CcI49_15005 [Frankia sp. CcI49]
MAEKSLIEVISAAFADAMRSALDGTNPALPPLSPPDAAGARAAIEQLADRAGGVTDAADPVAWLQALESWRDTASDVADRAFAGPNPAEQAFVRFLTERMPRTAAFLALTGVISHTPDGLARVDRQKLRALVTDPGTLVNEGLWDALLADVGLPGTGRLPAVIVGLLLLAPQTVLALTRGDLRVAGLSAPPTAQPGPWRVFREATEGWISITVPIGDPADPQPNPRDMFDWAADLTPDLSGTLAIRSQRHDLGGGKRRTVFEMWLALAAEEDRWQYDFGSGWYLRVEPGLTGGFGYDGSWHGAFRQFALDPARLPGPGDPVEVTFGRELDAGAPDIAFGPPYDTRLVIRDLGLFLRLREDHPVVEVGLFLHGLSAVLTNRWFRTFGVTDTVFRDGIRLDLDLDLAYVEGRGVVLGLSSGLDVTLGIDAEFGKNAPVGFKLHSIRIHVPVRATEDSFDVRAEVRFHISTHLGPVSLVADGLGGWVGYWSEDDTRKYVGLLPPTGAGLEISAGPFTGGGYLDFTGGPNERFGGVIHVKVGTFEVTAFGLHELTGEPGAANRPTSVIVVLGVRFSPGIPLGFGFEISGFGGLIGINRRADTDALRERLTSGAAGNVLFAEDPIRNAPRLLDDLDHLFPRNAGTHVFGPTIQISWLNIAGHKVFRFDVGLFFEFPGPRRIVLLGSARAQLPPLAGGPHLIDIRFDIVGFVDFPKRIVEVDATLINSSVMEIFHLTGDLAFRIAWGDHPYLLLSFGGFHPRFTPLPAQFPELARLALTVKPGKLPGGVFFRAEAYLAITSNTVQFGGQVELGYKAGPLNLIGFLALDALIQFTPFHFEVTISAGVRLRWKSTNLAGVRLEGTLSGPGPFTVSGKACFEILWFDICADVRIQLGSSGQPAAPPVSSVVQALRPQLTEPANLTALDGDDNEAIQARRPAAAGDHPLVSPLGGLSWAQKRTPLGLTLDRFDGVPLAAPQRVVVESPRAAGPVQDWFAPGSYANLTEAERLNRPAFSRLDAGIRIGLGAPAASTAIRRDVTVVEIRLPKPPSTGALAIAFAAVTLRAALERTAPSQVRTTAPAFGVREERFAVRDRGGAVLAEDLSVSEAHQRARRAGGVAAAKRDLVDLGAI